MCLSTLNLQGSAQTKVVKVNTTPTSQVRLPALPGMSLGLTLTTPSFGSSLHTQLGSPNSLNNWSEFDLSGVPGGTYVGLLLLLRSQMKQAE